MPDITLYIGGNDATEYERNRGERTKAHRKTDKLLEQLYRQSFRWGSGGTNVVNEDFSNAGAPNVYEGNFEYGDGVMEGLVAKGNQVSREKAEYFSKVWRNENISPDSRILALGSTIRELNSAREGDVDENDDPYSPIPSIADIFGAFEKSPERVLDVEFDEGPGQIGSREFSRDALLRLGESGDDVSNLSEAHKNFVLNQYRIMMPAFINSRHTINDEYNMRD